MIEKWLLTQRNCHNNYILAKLEFEEHGYPHM